jgi:lipopolysaccharide export system permease protein
LKTLHRFLIKSYIPPFLLTLLIGMFIFFIIFVFVYVDEIAGKGIDNWTLTQLLFYTFISNLPISAPLAVLLSSIMTMGNLAEQYELAALKSSGLSLFNIMRPLIFFIFILAIATFVFSNYTMPYINLKAGRLLWDVRQKKPAFNVQPGIYYGGLDDYRIKVDGKGADGQSMKGIYIADHSHGQGNNVQMRADSGVMRTTNNGDYLEIHIYDAIQYRHILETDQHQRTRPFVKMHFEEQEIKIDLSELKMQSTQEELFKNNYQMLNLRQLDNGIDSFKRMEVNLKQNIYTQLTKNFTTHSNVNNTVNDSLNKPHIAIADYLKLYDANGRNFLVDKALETLRSADSYISSTTENELQGNKLDQLVYRAEWHKKLTLPVACIVLFFVGAPLGAIVRKGGMGMPVVISVVMFIFYHVVKTSLEKSYLEGALDAFTGLWGSTIIFLPFGIWLTWMAANDSAIFEKSSYKKVTRFFYKSKSDALK